jgi:hypothetical protein
MGVFWRVPTLGEEHDILCEQSSIFSILRFDIRKNIIFAQEVRN